MKLLIHFSLSILCLLLAFNPLSAQKEGAQWYFGNKAGMYFANGTGDPVKWGVLESDEAGSAICDGIGQLLFYTGGGVVYNTDHVKMPNGYGMFGHGSATQGNMILPLPESPGIYFIFTLGSAEENFSYGLRYSVVDMSLDGGKGDVVAKNIPLLSTSTEKLAAVPHANGCDIWLIAHGYDSRTFHVYLINKDGIDPNPVNSDIGSIHGGLFPGPMLAMIPKNARGSMTTSLDGSRIATAIHWDGVIDLLDFDAATGRLSNPTSLAFQNRVYGLEFSPDGSKLYASIRTWNGEIFQMDLEAGNPTDIVASAVQIGMVPNDGPGAIQMAPDGKMYVARWRQDYLATISEPNLPGAACDFKLDGVYLRRKKSGLGLPAMMSSYKRFPGFNTYQACAEQTTFFNFENTATIDSVWWEFGDPASGTDNRASGLTTRHLYFVPGTYIVQLFRLFKGGHRDTVSETITVKNQPIVDLGPNQVLCLGDSINLDVTQSGKNVTYFWQDSSSLPVFTIKEEGRYVVSVNNSCGTTEGAVVVAYADPPQVNLGPDFGLCADSIQAVGISQQRLTGYRWQDGSTGTEFLIEQPGKYWLRATNACGVFTDTLTVFPANCDCELFVPNVFTPNGDGINEVFQADYGCSPQLFRMAVYDRWGKEIYRSDALDRGWDGYFQGRECPVGTYYYAIEFEGDPRVEAVKEILTGALTLLR